MQRDSHFNAILALCIRAGYSPDEAKLIAWANYQCDCTSLTQVKWPWQIFTSVGRFFHFVVGASGVVEANSPQVFMLVKRAETLIQLGIALHAFMDSYSHKGFVGRLDKRNEMGLKTSWLRRLIPHYGHTQVGLWPDRCDVVWTDTRTGEVRNNAEIFSQALYEAYRLLRKSDTPAMAGEIERVCFEKDYDERKKQWAMLAGMPDIRFSAITKEYWAKHGKEFKAAARRQKQFLGAR